jgi:hypothetical protein
MLYWGHATVGFAPLVNVHGGAVVEFNTKDIPINVNYK